MEKPQVFQEVEDPRLHSNQHMKVVRLSALHAGCLYPPIPPLPPGNIPSTHFCSRLSWSQGHSVASRIMSMKTDTIRNRTPKLLACRAVPQLIVPLHTPNIIWLYNKVLQVIISLKYDLAYKPIVTCSFSHVMTTRDHTKESASSISSSKAPPLTSCIFLCWHVTVKADTKLVSNFGKQLHKNMKCLNLFMKIKLYFVCISSNGLKDWERNMRTLKISMLLAAIGSQNQDRGTKLN